MGEKKISVYKKVLGSVCHHCPICKYGRKNPESMIGKMLHHKLHADNCPFWKSEKEVYENHAR